MKAQRFLLAAGLAAYLVTCAPAPEEPVEEAPTAQTDVEAIKKAHQDTLEPFNAGDLDTLMTFFTEEAVYMPPGMPVLHGKQAIRDFYAQFKTKVDSLSTDEVIVAGDWAFERGSVSAAMTVSEGSEAVQVTGKFLDIWQRQPDGSWKIARVIWNLDSPLPGQ